MSGANGVLVECPICYGCGMLTNSARDPQDHEDGECHACSGGGAVTEQHRVELLDGMNDDALAALREHEQQLTSDAEIERLLQQELAERDREWWS